MLELQTSIIVALKPSLVANRVGYVAVGGFDKTRAKPCQEKNPPYSFNFAEQLQN